MSVSEVKVPDIGDFDEVEVIEVLVSVGDTVAVEQSLITVESDKASMEIPSSAAGVVESVSVAVGDKVSEGSVVVRLTTQADAPAPEPAPAAAPPAAAPAASAPTPAAPAPAAAAPAGGGDVTVVVPDIGDFDGVEVIEILVNVGDEVGVEQSLITVESDKASMEIPSSSAGTVAEILVKIGDTVARTGCPAATGRRAGAGSIGQSCRRIARASGRVALASGATQSDRCVAYRQAARLAVGAWLCPRTGRRSEPGQRQRAQAAHSA